MAKIGWYNPNEASLNSLPRIFIIKEGKCTFTAIGSKGAVIAKGVFRKPE